MLEVITGLMNSGKTLYLTKLTLFDYLRGNTIYTNYHLNFPYYKGCPKIILINLDFMIKLSENNYIMKNVSFALDEFWIWNDSRSSGTNNSNKMISYLFNQSSKDDTKIRITAQDNNQNDIRVRKNMHKITQCSRVIYNIFTKKMLKINDEIRILPRDLQDKLYIECNTYKKLNINGDTILKKQPINYLKASNYFKYYDTREKIKPVGDKK